MLSETKLSLLQQLVHNASEKEIIWANGYLAGFLAQTNGTSLPETVKEIAVSVKPTIIYGTETGNSKKIASQLLGSFKKNKVQAKVADVFQYDANKLQKENLVLFVMSTQGEGEFPQNAVAFYEKLKVSNANLSHLKYAVLGLGDSSYPLFCNAGILLDETLQKLGATPILPLVTCDVDFAEAVAQWETQLLAVFNEKPTGDVKVTLQPKQTVSHKKNYQGIINHRVVLNDIGSNKETYHIEISANEEIFYEPGDALGILPKNSTQDVLRVIRHFNEDPAKIILLKETSLTLEEALFQLNIKGLSKRSLDQIAELFQTTIDFEKADLLDVLEKYPAPDNLAIENLIALLLPIAPRLYSIASSAEAHDGQVHLTVSLNTFKVNDTIKTGLASQFLADFPLDTPLDFYIHQNNNFRLPAEDDKPIIMIGPGTGIAPFRSFIAHRDATGAEGKNWLFFGEQHFVQDFYYQTEIQEWIASGVLTKFDAAFSRDQKEKVYVQDRIRQNAKDFNEWLEEGASLYICGQKAPMSIDVENTIVEVIAAERSISTEAAQQVLEQLETEGRYQKDVY